MLTEKTLWFTVEQPREYFLVPDGVGLPAGMVCIRSLRGEERTVDAVSLESFAIPEEEAKVVLRTGIMDMLEQLPDALPDIVAQLDGQSLDVRGMLDALPPSVEFSQADLRTLVETLRRAFAREGMQAQSLEELIAQLEVRGTEGMTAWVGQLGDWLSDASEDESRRINRLLDRLNRQLAELSESDVPHQSITDEQRRQYKESARRAIADSLRQVDFHPRPHQRSDR